MNAIFQAKRMYQEAGHNFEQDLGHYLTNGYVVSEPGRFIMFKPVRKDLGEKDWHSQNPDTWYVHCAVGRGAIRSFLNLAPFDLPYIAWSRFRDAKSSLNVYPKKRFERLVA